MIPIIRNFLHLIRRYKLAIVLNILGLSVAFAAFMVIMTQLHYDFSYDKFHKDDDKIFRVESPRNIFSENASVWRTFPCPFAVQFIESSPHILVGAVTTANENRCRFHIEKEDGERHYYEDTQLTVTPSFFDLFSFNFVEGSKESIVTESVFIPLSLARKLFGNESAAGKQIFHSNRKNYTVAAVYRDFPTNSIINNCLYFAMDDEDKYNWFRGNYVAFIRVNDPLNIPLIVDNFKRSFDAPENERDRFDWEDSDIRLTALKDLHWVTDVEGDPAPKGNKQALMILFAIAIVIVTIACINFTNFSVALASKRMKTINTQRVFGASRFSVRISIVFEAAFLSLLAYLIAILFFAWFFSTPLVKLFDADLSAVGVRPLIVGGTALIALLAGLLAGLYPARYMTSFEPALVLKGSFGLSPEGRRLRNMMTGIQFLASFTLIIITSFIYLQNRFMQNSPLGYDKDDIINVNNLWPIDREAFLYGLRTYQGIEAITYGQALLANSDDQYQGWRQNYGEQIFFRALPVHYSFLDVMGIEMFDKHKFNWENVDVGNGVYVFNETAKKEFNLELNASVGRHEIIGFMPDIKFASFRKEVEPMAFFVTNSQEVAANMGQIYIRLKSGADKRAVMSHIHATIAEVAPANPYPPEIFFYDEILQRLYEKERAQNTLITLFSLIAIFISFVGVFGLVVFDGEYRRKEVGIRKTLGATTTGIIIMFNKAYIKILLITVVIAAPIAWYAVTRWLENFAYKTPMHWWVYLLAFVVVGIITVATVTFQNWRVANDDPVKAIKSE